MPSFENVLGEGSVTYLATLRTMNEIKESFL